MDLTARHRAVDHAATAMVVLAVLAADPTGWFAFAPIKWATITTGSAVIVTLAAWAGTMRIPDRTATAVMAALVAWLGLAAALGEDPRYAWLGTPERHSGWMLWVICLLMFVSGVRWTAVTNGLVLAGAAMAPILVAEALGHPFIDVGTERLAGTFGSAAYLAAATTLIVPASLGAALDTAGARWLRVVAWVATFAGVFGLVGSGTRGAWLAAAVVSGFVGWRHRSSRLVWHVVTVCSAAAVLAIVATPAAQRVGSTFDGRAAGGASRLDEWRVGANAAADHLLTGVGPEGYRIVFGQSVDADYERAHGRTVQPDRSHNAVLDMAIIGGLPAAGLYAAFVVVATQRLARRRWSPASAGAVAAAAMYALQQQLLFPLAELEPIVFLLVGGLLVDVPESRPSPRGPAPVRSVLAVGAAGVAVFMLAWGIADVRADRAAASALDAAAAGDITLAGQRANHALGHRSDQVRLHLLAAEFAPTADDALAAIGDALDISPGDPIALIRRATVLTDADPSRAVLELAELTYDDPYNAQLRLLYGTAAARTGDLALAEEHWLIALDLAPDSPGPRANLITLYRQQDRNAEADALELGNQ